MHGIGLSEITNTLNNCPWMSRCTHQNFYIVERSRVCVCIAILSTNRIKARERKLVSKPVINLSLRLAHTAYSLQLNRKHATEFCTAAWNWFLTNNRTIIKCTKNEEGENVERVRACARKHKAKCKKKCAGCVWCVCLFVLLQKSEWADKNASEMGCRSKHKTTRRRKKSFRVWVEEKKRRKHLDEQLE